MAKVIRKTWLGSGATGVPRRDRRPCSYEAYVPDTLVDREVTLEGAVAADVADAERALARLDAEAVALSDTEALARLLLRAESVASSRIEGLEAGGRRLLRAELAREMGVDARDVTAAEVLGNIEAMTWAMRLEKGEEISLERILEVHRRLLRGTRQEAQGGRLRTEQNWLGGSDYNPCSAAFVPPPPEHVESLLRDICEFCNDDALPAVAQAAIAHAQFETVHPFVDGNGRAGRALIQMVLRRRGLCRQVTPPVSLVLATRTRAYIDGLTATRYLGAADSDGARQGLNVWVGEFAAACVRAVEDSERFERRVCQIQEGWRARAGPVRRKSALDALIGAIPGAPLLTVGSAAAMIDRSFEATNQAVQRLVRAEVLNPVSLARRNRAFEAWEIVDAFTDFERALVSPDRDTRISPPARRVPRRPVRS